MFFYNVVLHKHFVCDISVTVVYTPQLCKNSINVLALCAEWNNKFVIHEFFVFEYILELDRYSRLAVKESSVRHSKDIHQFLES